MTARRRLDKLEQYLARSLPLNDFRDLPHPVFITAVDLDRAERVVFGPGYLDRVPVTNADFRVAVARDHCTSKFSSVRSAGSGRRGGGFPGAATRARCATGIGRRHGPRNPRIPLPLRCTARSGTRCTG